MLKVLSKTKYLEKELKNIINKNNIPHSKFLSENDIKTKYSVSLATIRSALSNLENNGLIYKIPSKGTYISPKIKKNIILIVTNIDENISNPFSNNTTIFNFIYTILSLSTKNEAYIPVMIKTEELTKNSKDIDLIYKNLKGIILLQNSEAILKTKNILIQKKIPIFFFGSDTNFNIINDINYMIFSSKDIVYSALNYLKEIGHKNIAIVYNELKTHVKRYKEYLNWHKENNIKINEKNIFFIKDFESEDFYTKLVNKLFNKPLNYTAIFSVSDLISLKILYAAKEKNINIPKNIGVLSVNNDNISAMTIPPLTTIAGINDIDIINKCINNIIRLSKGEINIFREKINIKIIKRGSV